MGSNIAGIVTGLLSKGGPSIDLSALYNTIQNAGQYQQQIINALPADIQKNLATYAQSQNKAGATYQNNTQTQLNDYLGKITGLYGPNSAAAQAQKAANTQSIYSTVPGTQNAIRNALAATGGLQRGAAGTALAQPYVAAAQANSQANANVNAAQTAAGQQATQQALSTVNSMEASMFQQLFGMSKEQATQILTSGNQALQTQLSDLINQSNNQTNQTLGVEGIQANNNYQNAVADTANTNGIIANGVNLGINGLSSMYGNFGGGDMSGIFQGLTSGGGYGLGPPASANTMQYAPMGA